jgi:hypothetical protein
MTGRFKRPCLKCGTLTLASYCEEHQPPRRRPPETAERKAKKAARYDSTYRKIAKHIKATTTRCHICGGPYRPDDPWEADHLFPDDPTRKYEIAGAHRSCNQKRGNKPLGAPGG